MPDSKNKKPELPKKVDTTLADNMRMVLEKHRRQNNDYGQIYNAKSDQSQ